MIDAAMRASARPLSAGASRPHAPSNADCAERDGRVDVGCIAARDRRERRAVRRIDDGNRQPARRGDEAAVDEVLAAA